MAIESLLPVHPTAVRRPHAITVQSENTLYSDEHITAKFINRGSEVTITDGHFNITPTLQEYEFQTKRAVSKTGYVMSLRLSPPSKLPYHSLLMIGVGGNNGTTLCATVLANRHNIVWHTKAGIQQLNYIGSLSFMDGHFRFSTIRLHSGVTSIVHGWIFESEMACFPV